MGRTALYHDPVPFRPARTEVQLDLDVLLLRAPDGRQRRHALHGTTTSALDGSIAARPDGRGDALARGERRFVRMLVIEEPHGSITLITPPEQGAVAPGVVRVPEAPLDAAVLDAPAWEALADWLLGGGRLAACSIVELARLVAIATAPFAGLIGEVAAQRALELAWAGRGPLRGGLELEVALQPLFDAARHCPRAAEALVAAQAFAAGWRSHGGSAPAPRGEPRRVPGGRRRA